MRIKENDMQPHLPTIVLLDDDPNVHDIVRWMLRDQPYRVHAAHDVSEFERICSVEEPDVVLLDWQLGGMDGLDVIGSIHRRLPDVPVVLITAHSSAELAVTSIKVGAFDFLAKPLDQGRLLTTLLRAVEHRQLSRRVHDLMHGDSEAIMEGMIGLSSAMKTIRRIIRNVAATDVSVMILGESGTGKEVVAQAIHRLSKRRDHAMVALNMAALPKELVESTLFGHEKGAFTGADRKRLGACAEADGGTLFLDEIGEMPIDLQPKLLRFLQDQRYRRVGGDADQQADVRLVSATNRDVNRQIRDGELREDLYHRLNVVPIHLPPLREREGDVELLAAYALQKYAAQYGKQFEGFEDAAMSRLESFDWPGNVRQLLHVVERVVVLNRGPIIRASMLPVELDAGDAARHGRVVSFQPDVEARRAGPVSETRMQTSGSEHATVREASFTPDAWTPRGNAVATQEPDTLHFPNDRVVPITELEKAAIEHAMSLCDDSPSRAARRLGISEATIYRKLKSYNIRRDKTRGAITN
ncbi:MAG: response regulator [Phycisphaera sp.]|nr:response regulator [Phycisphaera sp.]